MSDNNRGQRTRLQAVLTKVLRYYLSQSLEQVESSIRRWRSKELDPFEVHAEVIKHAARAEQMAARIAQADQEFVNAVLRDAFDAKLIDRDEFIDLVGAKPETVEPAGGLASNTETVLPEKRPLIEELLAEGPVLLRVDARREGVRVPSEFCQDPRLVLRFGYNLSPVIADLHIDDESISGTLTFQGKPYHCVVPWPSLYAVVSEPEQRGMVWPDDVPGEVLEEFLPPPMGPGAGPPMEKAPVAGAAKTPPSSASKPDKPRPRASHLKLVD